MVFRTFCALLEILWDGLCDIFDGFGLIARANENGVVCCNDEKVRTSNRRYEPRVVIRYNHDVVARLQDGIAAQAIARLISV